MDFNLILICVSGSHQTLEVTIPEQYPQLPLQSIATIPFDATFAQALNSSLTLKQLLDLWSAESMFSAQ
jgi:hypothetical protein